MNEGSTTFSMRLSLSLYSWLFAILCVATIAGFFFSRALVSIGGVLLLFLNIYQFGWKQVLSYAWKNHFTKICIGLLSISALSFFWSANIGAWEKDTVTKLLLLVMPLSMIVPVLEKKKVLKTVLYSINTMVLITVLNSLRIYFQNPELAHQQYMLTTTLYGDHIRFSFLIALNILLNFYLLFEWRNATNKSERVFALLSIIVPFAYLHMLSARTGLMCAYAGLGLVLLLKAWQYKKVLALAVLGGLALLPVVAIQLSPRLADKVQYMIWEVTEVKDEDPSVQFNYSDNNRVLSYKVAQELISNHPLLGVGAGDLRDSMKGTYARLYPTIPQEGRLEVPHMQVLSTAVALGAPIGLLGILGLLLTPLWYRYKRYLYIGINMTLMLLFFMVDANLEIQFGLLIFLFYTLMWMLLERDSVQDASISKN